MKFQRKLSGEKRNVSSPERLSEKEINASGEKSRRMDHHRRRKGGWHNLLYSQGKMGACGEKDHAWRKARVPSRETDNSGLGHDGEKEEGW